MIFSESHHLVLELAAAGPPEEHILCGNIIPEDIISEHRVLMLRMKVDNNDAQYKGYEISYECLPPQCTDDAIVVGPEDSQSGSLVSHYDYPGPYTDILKDCNWRYIVCDTENYRYVKIVIQNITITDFSVYLCIDL